MYCSVRKLHRLLTSEGVWREVETKYPSWFDKHTRGCPHPDGVILAGSSKEGYEKKVVFLDIYRNNVVKLQDLEHNLKNVGMVFDDNTGKLTMAGGKNPDGTLSSLVLQLPRLNKDAAWEELKVLEEPVAYPMLVNDKEYLYVLGGERSRKCVRMCKKPKNEDEKEWKNLENLPEPEAKQDNEYSGGLYSGAIVDQGKITVFTRTNFLVLEDPLKPWTSKSYVASPQMSKGNITHMTLISHGEKIAAGIKRQFASLKTFEMLITDHDGNKSWYLLKSASQGAQIGAGKFVSVNMKI